MNGMKATKSLTLTGALILALLAGPAARAGNAQSITLLSGSNISNNFSPELPEASGLGLAKNKTTLWSVSDANFTMYKMDLTGTAVESFNPTRASGAASIGATDFEGVTFGPPPPNVADDHFIYLVNERANAIVPVNYNTRKYYSQVPLSSMAGYTSVTCLGGDNSKVYQEFEGSDINSGLEGITWNGDLQSFFVVKEKGPGLMIRISADLQTITACRRLGFSGGDYSGIGYDTARRKYWIVSDEDEAVYLYDWNTATSVRYPLGYGGGEGVSFNPDNSRLYIVTDNGEGNDSFLYTYRVQ